MPDDMDHSEVSKTQPKDQDKIKSYGHKNLCKRPQPIFKFIPTIFPRLEKNDY